MPDSYKRYLGGVSYSFKLQERRLRIQFKVSGNPFAERENAAFSREKCCSADKDDWRIRVD